MLKIASEFKSLIFLIINMPFFDFARVSPIFEH